MSEAGVSPDPSELWESTPSLAYAKVGAGSRWGPPKSPRRPLWLSAIVGAAALAGALLALVAANAFFVLCTLLGWPLALAALILTAVAAWRNSNPSLPNEQRLKAARLWGTLAVAAALLLTQTVLALTALGRTRGCAKAAVSAANLRGILQCVAIYSGDYGEYPATLDDLVIGGYTVPRQLRSMSEMIGAPYTSSAPFYSSFTYRPGKGACRNDPALVIGFERSALTPLDLRIFTRWGRVTAFGDGHVEVLDEKAFKQALRKDKQRRSQLGWPIPPDP